VVVVVVDVVVRILSPQRKKLESRNKRRSRKKSRIRNSFRLQGAEFSALSISFLSHREFIARSSESQTMARKRFQGGPGNCRILLFSPYSSTGFALCILGPQVVLVAELPQQVPLEERHDIEVLQANNVFNGQRLVTTGDRIGLK